MTPTETVVAKAFEEVLGIGPIQRGEDFFELGGDSFLAVSVGIILEDRFRIELPVDLLEEVTTVAEIAAWLDAGA